MGSGERKNHLYDINFDRGWECVGRDDVKKLSAYVRGAQGWCLQDVGLQAPRPADDLGPFYDLGIRNNGLFAKEIG